MEKRKVIKFYAQWCGPCKAYAPIFEKVQAELEPLGYTFESIDVDQQSDLIVDYKIKSIPTTIVLEGDTVYKTLTGILTQDQLSNLIIE